MPTGTASRRCIAAVLVAAAGMAVAGCGGGLPAIPQAAAGHQAATGKAAARPASSASPASPDRPVAPLTGLPAGSARTASMPAVALPLAGPDPQGLSSADVVYEEITSPIRYIAVFQSHEAQAAGPVTATRPADGQALSVLHPIYGYDGGTAPFIKVLDQTNVVDVGYARHPSLYHAGAAGPTVSTSQAELAARGTAPPQLFTYQGTGIGSAPGFASTGTWRPSALEVSVPGLGTQKWTFDARTGRWADVSGGPRVEVANLVVQAVPYKNVNLSTRYGLTVPSARVTGRGSALVLSETGGQPGSTRSGVAVRGSWAKPGIQKITDYVDSRGVLVGFQPGPTWVILAPPGTRVMTTPGGP
jgi:hypothetical protein